MNEKSIAPIPWRRDGGNAAFDSTRVVTFKGKTFGAIIGIAYFCKVNHKNPTEMNTVTLSPGTYQSVADYAHDHHMSINKVVEEALLSVIVRYEQDKRERDYMTLSELRGLIRSGSAEKDYKESVEEHLAEKYSL